MGTIAELFFSTTYNVLAAAILIYALTTIYQLCVSLWTIIRLVRRMNWPNITLKFVQHPKFFQTLYNGEASKYRATRKMFMPIFHNKMTATCMPLFNEHILATASQLQKYVNKGEFVVESYVERCVVKCNADFLLGMTASDEEIETFIQLMRNMTTIIYSNMIRWCKLPRLIYKITPTGRAHTKFMEQAEELYCEAIRRRKEVLAQKNAGLGLKIEPSREEDDATEKVLIDILLDPERKNGGDTFAELMLFGKASVSTTIHTINAALMMLAYHPEEQRKVYQELYDIYGSATPEDVPVVLSDHHRMHCMKRVIKETMRLFPPLPFIARSVEEDIRIGDQTIPKGCDACIFIYGMHRSKRYWANSLKFDSDRFLPENSMDRSSWVYLPFSEGPRKCPAYTIGMEMVTQFLATTLRKYIISSDSITLVQDIKIKSEIVSSFIEPVKIKIERRQPIGSTKLTAGED